MRSSTAALTSEVRRSRHTVYLGQVAERDAADVTHRWIYSRQHQVA